MKLFLALAFGGLLLASALFLVGPSLSLDNDELQHNGSALINRANPSDEKVPSQDEVLVAPKPVEDIAREIPRTREDGIQHSEQLEPLAYKHSIPTRSIDDSKTNFASPVPTVDSTTPQTFTPSSSSLNPGGFAVIEEVVLPDGEIAPLVLESVTENSAGPEAQAMDNISENYLENLEDELAMQHESPQNGKSNAARRADEQLRAIVGYQEADRLERENYLSSIQD